MRVDSAVNIDDLRELARARLPSVVFDYLEGGAEDEVTRRANREAFLRYAFVPSVATGHVDIDLSTNLFGDPVAVPHRGDRLLLIPGHCDPTVNLHDWYVCVRGLHGPDAHVEALWPVAARGALT